MLFWMADLKLDFKRAWGRRTCGNRVALALENLFQPCAVAVVVAIAYLCRGDVEAHRDTFVYFSGLYAFWIGLFGSCQSVNRELQNGEWRYWVLGLGRNRHIHATAIAMVNFLFSLMQLVCFIMMIALIGWVNSLCGGNILPNFLQMFVSTDSSLASPLFQMGCWLRRLVAANFGTVAGPLMFAMFFFSLSLFCAMVTGCGFGFMFSAMFKSPSVSLNLSVGFVVILGTLSLCGLRGTGSQSGDDSVTCAFFPEIERYASEQDAREKDAGEMDESGKIHLKKLGPNSNVRWLVTASRFLPQRYFFNLGRLTFNRRQTTSAIGVMAEDLRVDMANQPPPWLRTGSRHVYSDARAGTDNLALLEWLGSNMDAYSAVTKEIESLENANDELRAKCDVETEQAKKELLETELKLRVNSENEEVEKIVITMLRNHKEVAMAWRFDLWRKLISRAICLEMLPLALIFMSCVLISALTIQYKEVYYDLR